MFPGIGFRAPATTGVLAWLTASRTFLFDVSDSTKTTMSGTKVVGLADVGGDSTRSFSQTAGDQFAPETTTAFGRLMLDYDNRTGIVGIKGSAAVVSDMYDLTGPATYVVLFKPPASLPTGDLPLLAAYTSGVNSPALRLIVTDNSQIYVVRQNNAGSNFDVVATPPTGFVWDSTKTYIIAMRLNADRTISIVVNDVSWSVAVPAYASTPTSAQANTSYTNVEIGYQNSAVGEKSAVGKFGMVGRYGIALSAAQMTTLNSVRQSRYPGSG